MADELTIERVPEKAPHTIILRVWGSLDIATSPRMREALAQAASERPRDLLIDVTRLEFLDSTGLGALIGAHRRAGERGGRVELIVKDGPIARLLNITGLSRVFAVYDSVDEALLAISAV